MTERTTAADEQQLQNPNECLDELTQRVDDLEAENEQLRDQVSEQNDRIAELEEKVEAQTEELAEYRTHNERDKATIRKDVTAVKDDLDTQSEEAGTDEGGNADDLTPIERLSLLGGEETAIQVTSSVERAVTIYENFDQWAHKTPKGWVLKDGLKTLLQTARDETLRWKQVYRAAEALDDLSKGEIEFTKHRRHGNMLIREEQPGRCQSSSVPA